MYRGILYKCNLVNPQQQHLIHLDASIVKSKSFELLLKTWYKIHSEQKQSISSQHHLFNCIVACDKWLLESQDIFTIFHPTQLKENIFWKFEWVSEIHIDNNTKCRSALDNLYAFKSGIELWMCVSLIM